MMGPRRLAGGLALSLTVCLLTLVWVHKFQPVLPPPDPEHQLFLGPECLRTAHESHDCAGRLLEAPKVIFPYPTTSSLVCYAVLFVVE
jgi:hypothetical protein